MASDSWNCLEAVGRHPSSSRVQLCPACCHPPGRGWVFSDARVMTPAVTPNPWSVHGDLWHVLATGSWLGNPQCLQNIPKWSKMIFTILPLIGTAGFTSPWNKNRWCKALGATCTRDRRCWPSGWESQVPTICPHEGSDDNMDIIYIYRYMNHKRSWKSSFFGLLTLTLLITRINASCDSRRMRICMRKHLLNI